MQAQSRLQSSLHTGLGITGFFVLMSLLWFGPVTLGARTILPTDNLFQYEPFIARAAELGVEHPHNPLLSDLVLQNLPWREHIRQSMSQGEWPLWNPYQFAGAPFLAKGQHLALYPLSLPFLLLPAWKAFGVFIALHLALAAVFAYVLARSLGLRPFEALVTGITYGFSGFVLANAVFPVILVTVAWLPLLLATTVRLTGPTAINRGLMLHWIVVGALALGMIALAAHPEMLYYTLLASGLLGMWRWLSLPANAARGTPLAAGVGVLVLGLMLGAVQLMPQSAVLSESFRAGASTLEQVRGYALPWYQALAFVLPDAFGNPSHGHYRNIIDGETLMASRPLAWGRKNFVEGAVYVGILPLLLAGAAMSGLRPRPRRAAGEPASPMVFLALLLLSLAFAFGTPLYALVYLLPGMEQVHSPFRWTLIATLSLAVLAGYGVRTLAGTSTGTTSDEHRPDIAGGLARAAVVTGLSLLLLLIASLVFYPSMAPLLDMLFRQVTTARQVFPDVNAFHGYQFPGVLRLALLALASGLVIALARCKLPVRFLTQNIPLWQAVLVPVLVFDLFLFAHGLYPQNDPRLLDEQPAVVKLLAAGSPPARITTFDPADRKTLNANSAWLLGLHDLRGYDSVFSADYARVMAAIGEQDQLLYNRIAPIRSANALDSPLLDMFNLRFVLTEQWITSPRWQRVYDSGTLRVYENLEVLPRAWLMTRESTVIAEDPVAVMLKYDPRFHVIVKAVPGLIAAGPLVTGRPLPANIVDYRNNRVQIEARVEEPSWLVLADSFDQGWRARAGDRQTTGRLRPLEVHRVNGALRGILLDPGDWRVEFRYQPPRLLSGLLLSLVALITLILLLLTGRVQRSSAAA